MHHPDNNLHSGTSVLYSCPAGLSVQVPLPRNTAGPRCRPSQRSGVELPERKSPLVLAVLAGGRGWGCLCAFAEGEQAERVIVVQLWHRRESAGALAQRNPAGQLPRSGGRSHRRDVLRALAGGICGPASRRSGTREARGLGRAAGEGAGAGEARSLARSAQEGRAAAWEAWGSRREGSSTGKAGGLGRAGGERRTATGEARGVSAPREQIAAAGDARELGWPGGERPVAAWQARALGRSGRGSGGGAITARRARRLRPDGEERIRDLPRRDIGLRLGTGRPSAGRPSAGRPTAGRPSAKRRGTSRPEAGRRKAGGPGARGWGFGGPTTCRCGA